MSSNQDLDEKIRIKVEINTKEDDLCRLCAEKTFEYASVFIDNLHESLKTHFGLTVNIHYFL